MGLGLAFSFLCRCISSFQVAGISGISVLRSGNQITLSAGSAPSLQLGSNSYAVTEVFGVWALDDNGDKSATNGDQSGWKKSINFAGTGGITGWKTNPNSGLINDPQVFTYGSLTGSVESFGYHIRVSGNLPGGGNTAFFRPVEPGTLAALRADVALMDRRRRNR